MQMPHGAGGFLIDNRECAERVVELLRDPRKTLELGATGMEHIRDNFLITRLLGDKLRLLIRGVL